MKKILVVASLVLASCVSQSQNAGSSALRAHPLRLHPGADLRASLDSFVKERGISAGYVATCSGSLTRAAIRFADREQATTLEGPFEIVSLEGTLSPDGSHLHISISDGEGRTIGGHLVQGSLVYTTAEVVVIDLPELRFSRETDANTTWKELVIRSASTGK